MSHSRHDSSASSTMSSSWAVRLPQLWQTRHWQVRFLLPLSVLYGAVTGLRRWGYRMGLLSSYRAPVPVWIIGNLTVGGTGKTPLIQALVQQLQDRGVRVGIISRGYGGTGPFPHRVRQDDTAEQVGDEPLMLCQSLNANPNENLSVNESRSVPIVVGPDRRAAIELLLKETPLDLIISDDGLQHYALQRDVEWIVMDTARGMGNGWLLPAGPLREPQDSHPAACLLWNDTGLQVPQDLEPAQPPAKGTLNIEKPLTGIQPNVRPIEPPLERSSVRLSMRLEPGSILALGRAETPQPQPPQRVHAVAGIGNPQRFFATVTALGFEVVEHAFPDHHAYVREELKFTEPLPILTTAKDAVKLSAFSDLDLWVVPVSAALNQAALSAVDEALARLGIGSGHNPDTH